MIGDAHLEVRRHGTVVEGMDVRHGDSFRGRHPKEDEDAGANSKKIRTKVAQLLCVLVGSIGGGDVKIRMSDLLTWLPETDLGKVAQIPWQRPGIRSDDRDMRRIDAMLASELLDLGRQVEQILGGMSVSVGIVLVGRMKKNALPCIAGDEWGSENGENSGDRNGYAEV